MVGNGHTGVYSAVAIAVVAVIGFLIYAQYNPAPTVPAADTTTQPK